jgi:transposase-like protein
MSRKQKRYTQAEKSRFLRKFERSGGGAAAFCRRQKLSYHTFLKWRREADGAREAAAEPAQFVELEVKRAEVEIPPAVAGPSVELVLGGGMILRIYPQQGEPQP